MWSQLSCSCFLLLDGLVENFWRRGNIRRAPTLFLFFGTVPSLSHSQLYTSVTSAEKYFERSSRNDSLHDRTNRCSMHDLFQGSYPSALLYQAPHISRAQSHSVAEDTLTYP